MSLGRFWSSFAYSGCRVKTFKAYRIEQSVSCRAGSLCGGFVEASEMDFDQGDVLVQIFFTSLNHQDARVALGQERGKGRFPCFGGADFSGVVLESAAPRFRPGDKVLATGYGLGVSHHGGYAEYALVPAGWLMPLPESLSLFDSMAIGLAGLAAGSALTRMEENGLRPERGPVIVTGAAGGVGSLAIDMLAGRGYTVVALTQRNDARGYLESIGAARVLLLGEMSMDKMLGLDKGIWAGAIDVLGGSALGQILRNCKPGAVVASVGSCSDNVVAMSSQPFVSRGVALLGVDTIYSSFSLREKIWSRLSADLRPRHLEMIARRIFFAELPQALKEYFMVRSLGRTVVQIAAYE